MVDSDEDLLKEIRTLREEFEEYRAFSDRETARRRVENIQVLVSLGVVGAAITILSSRRFGSSLWQELLSSPYWGIIIKVFVAANVLFLTLKMITIPLRQFSDNEIILSVHEFWETFLYFFAVLGGVISIPFWYVYKISFGDISPQEMQNLALATFIIPAVLGFIIGRANRVVSAIYRSQLFLAELNHILERTAEQQLEIIDEVFEVFILTTPSPLVIDLLYELVEIVGWISPRVANMVKRLINNFVDTHSDEFKRMTSISIAGTAALLIYQKQIQEKYKDKGDKDTVKNIRKLRNKGAHGTLTEIEKEELKRLVEELEDGEDKEEDDESGSE